MKILSINNIIKVIIFSINFLYNGIALFSKFSEFFSFSSFSNEFKEIENYLKICENQKIIKNFGESDDKKISIISPIFNRQKFIQRFLNSIQNQTFKKIEIILVDDGSIDMSVQIIQNYIKHDKRIILIKNRHNKGTFVARNIGILYAKGKYIILPDPDDIISKNILKYCYNIAEKNNYEIIRFTIYEGDGNIKDKNYVYKLGNNNVHQTKLSTFIYYGYGELQIIDSNVSSKFIKTTIFIKALNSLHYLSVNLHLTIYMTKGEDNIMNYILFRTANSFYFTKKIGYYYIKSSASITKNSIKILKLSLKFILIYLKLLFEYSKNNKYERDMFNSLLINPYRAYKEKNGLSMINSRDAFSFCDNIVNNYLNCKYITKENKYYLLNLKQKIKKKLFKSKKFLKNN